MKALQIKYHGGIDSIELNNIDAPQCTADKVLVNIKASSINHLDIWVSNGLPGISIPLPLVLGSDASGTIIEVGSNVDSFKVGQNVVIQPGTYNPKSNFALYGKENYSSTYGILGETENGVHCECVLLNPNNIHLKPNHLSFEESASMQLVFMTSYQMLIDRAKLKKNETILIYGATSGIGSAAIQIAKSIGSKVITTVGSKNKIKYAEKFNPDYILLHSENNYVKEIKDITNNRGVDVVFEHIGPDTWQNSLKLLARGGRIVTCGATTGKSVNIDLRHLFMKQQSILGSTMASIKTFKEVMKNINNNKYRPFVDEVFKYSNFYDAYMRMQNRNQTGKIVLTP